MINEIYAHIDPKTNEANITDMAQDAINALTDVALDEILEETITAAEAENLWGLRPGTVRRACGEQRIKARKSGKVWLTTKNQMKRVYGSVQ